MFLTNLGRQAANISSEEVFEEAEWKSVCTVLNKQDHDRNTGRLSKKKKSSWSQGDMGRFEEAERICSYVELNTCHLVN